MILSTRAKEQRFRIKERGIVMVVVTLGMLALLAIAGLALDGGHLLLSKTRLQNVLDATALSTAKSIDETAKKNPNAIRVEARSEGTATFVANLNAPGNGELLDAYNDGDMTLSFEFSDTLTAGTFVANGDLPFVRVSATGLSLPAWLVQVVGVTEKRVAASAVSGPRNLGSSECEILPLVGCCSGGSCDDDQPDDTDGDGKPDMFGYPLATSAGITSADDVVRLKTPSGSDTPLGDGNYQLIRLRDEDGGANDLRNNFAKGMDCLDFQSEEVQTEPGNTVGPSLQGLNTRFGDYSGPLNQGDQDIYTDHITHVDDTVTFDELAGEIVVVGGSDFASAAFYDAIDYQTDTTTIGDCQGSGGTLPHGDHDAAYSCIPPNEVRPNRRAMGLPLVICDGENNGQNLLELTKLACFYLLQPIPDDASLGTTNQIFGQITGDCTPDLNNAVSVLPTNIVLFRDPESGDS
jgi:Flp pilus assembly protein TadG